MTDEPLQSRRNHHSGWWMDYPSEREAIHRPATERQQVVLDAMSTEWESCQEIADRIGVAYSSAYARLKACWRRRLVDRACIGPDRWAERVLWRRADAGLFDFIASELDGIGDDLIPLYVGDHDG